MNRLYLEERISLAREVVNLEDVWAYWGQQTVRGVLIALLEGDSNARDLAHELIFKAQLENEK